MNTFSPKPLKVYHWKWVWDIAVSVNSRHQSEFACLSCRRPSLGLLCVYLIKLPLLSGAEHPAFCPLIVGTVECGVLQRPARTTRGTWSETHTNNPVTSYNETVLSIPLIGKYKTVPLELGVLVHACSASTENVEARRVPQPHINCA